MEPTQTGFSLNQAIGNWQNAMLNGALTPDDVTELTQHLHDEITELQNKGLTDEEAWLVARNRMGNTQVIEEEFSKVNPDFAANRNWLMLFWGASIFMILQTLVFVIPGILKLKFFSDIYDQRNLRPIMDDITLQRILCGLCIALIVLLIVNLTRANKISVWFNKVLMDYSATISIVLVIAGSWVAFCNYAYVGDHMLNYPAKFSLLKNTEVLLAIIFYGSLIFSTAYFTIRYRKQELRSFKNFASNITWPVTFILGLVFQLTDNITHMFHSDIFSIAVVCILFGVLGWMIGFSKTYITNLLSAQTAALILFLAGLSINSTSWFFFFLI